MSFSIDKLKGITKEDNGIVKTANRSFDIEPAYYKPFGAVVKVELEDNKGVSLVKLLLTPTKARELSKVLEDVAKSTEEKYKNL